MVIALLAAPFYVFAQEPGSRPIVVAGEELPEAPQPQFVVASVEPLSQQTAAGQGQSVPQASAVKGSQEPQSPAAIMGTVTVEDGTTAVSGATVTLVNSVSHSQRTALSNDSGFFTFSGVAPGTYSITISGNGISTWTASDIAIHSGEIRDVPNIVLKMTAVGSTVRVTASQQEIAEEQVKREEHQRVLGIIPNYFVVYDPNPVPLTSKEKYRLSLKFSIDPVTFLGAGFLAGIKQAADVPAYVQGLKGYSERLGSTDADLVTDIMFGGAILPSLLHQDPRYFYQGTGTTKSRVLHALSTPFICKGDDGRLQPNYSTMGGDVISGAISNAYYPAANRGVALVYDNALLNAGLRAAEGLLQEFVLPRFTTNSRNQP